MVAGTKKPPVVDPPPANVTVFTLEHRIATAASLATISMDRDALAATACVADDVMVIGDEFVPRFE
jgi:hypothetical protein